MCSRLLQSVSCLLVLLIAACSNSDGNEAALLSADVRGVGGGLDTRGTAMPNGVPSSPSAPGDAGNDAAEREVAAADVYAVAGDRLFAANAYRGLAIVDLADFTLRSRTPLRGRPMELYLVGTRALVIVAGEGLDAALAQTRLVEVDVTDPASPSILGDFAMDGSFRDSRRIGDVLYIVTDAGASSFAIATAPTVPVAAVPLPGAMTFAHATDEFVYVARSEAGDTTRITLLDVRASGGAITTRGSLLLEGSVADAQKLHFGAGTLRVVTHDSNGVVSRLHTIRIDDPDAPAVLGELLLARGEQLFGTCFTDDRAYLVTFERIDPLWVVDLSNPALPRVLGELQVPGFSTQLVCSGNQLVSLGFDAPWAEPVLSLFDVADPTRPTLVSRIPVGSVDPEALHEHRALFVQSDLVLVPLWNGVAVVDRHATSLSMRGQFEVRGGSKRAFVHAQGLVAVGNEQVAVADPSTLGVRGSVTIAENVVDVAQLGDGSVVEVVQSGEQTIVRGTAVPLYAERAFAFGLRTAVLGWNQSGRVLQLFDCSTTPAGTSPAIEIGFGGYAAPMPPRGGLGIPNGGMFGYTSQPLELLLPDGLLLVRGLPRTASVAIGTGPVRDGFVGVDLASGQEAFGIEVRGSAISGACSDGSNVALTTCLPAGFDRAGRPMVQNLLHRIDVRSGSTIQPVPVPGAVIAIAGARVHTMVETWEQDWSFRTAVTALRIENGVATTLDRAGLPPFAYDFRTASDTLYYASNDLPTATGNGSVGIWLGNRIDSMRLASELTAGPSLAADAFRRPLLAFGSGLLCARDAQTVEFWDFGGAAPVAAFTTSVEGFPQTAIADGTTTGTFVVATGYGGSVRVP